MIDRRRFLKALGLGSMAAALSVWPRAEPTRASSVPRAAASPVQLPEVATNSPTILFRGDGGVILVSRDDGATWTRHAHLGPEYMVKQVRTSRSGQVGIDVGYAGRTFQLVLTPDGRAWRTA